ncbi:glycine-rich protein [Mesonia mobilis]|uniref:glycine-rich protein n=1 Tax=Mesonia mobilis TaxID=369791 RepID=UPI0024B977D4|nr:glycine-rich protein [Mesonia mobilis]
MKKNYSKRSSNAYCKKMYWLATIFILAFSYSNLKAQTTTFNYTGASQTYIVPGNATHIKIECWGAQGGTGIGFDGIEGTGGLGGYMSGDIIVTPGQVLEIFVGGAGAASGPGGFNGGGHAATDYGGAGGGASDVRIGTYTLMDRIIVGGGGGGGAFGSYGSPGGPGGGLVGGSGTDGPSFTGGGGGTQTAGGNAGCCYGASSAGTFGFGAGPGDYHNAGGGGGWYGGGSGAGHAGAGGGSSYISNDFTNTSTLTGVNSGDGRVVITVLCDPLTLAPVDTSVCDGSTITLDATSSNGGTITWDNGITNNTPFTINSTTTFTATSSHPDDCSKSVAITVTNPPTLTNTTTDVSCNGGNNGTVDLTVTGGAAPYTFAWSNSATTEDLSGLTAGTYNITVTDANGCTTTQSVEIQQPAVLSASGVATDVSCNGGNDGTIDLTVVGGTPPYTFAWSNTATTEDLSGLEANTYNVTVTDSKGCTATESVEIQQPAMLSASGVATDVSCNGGNNGTIDLTVVGGTPPYTFAWSNTATTEDLSGLEANTYNVTVTDANGCTTTESIEVTEPTLLIASAIATNVSCNGGNNGTVDLTVTGGIAPYTFTWSNTATTEDLSGLSAGIYEVSVTDANGCTTTESIEVTEPTLLITSATVTNVSCNGGNNGTIDLTVTGGTTPYTYAWSNTATTENLSGLEAGTYDVTVTDANGCTSTSSVAVTEPTVLSVNSVATNVSCNGGNNGAIDLTVTGGIAPYTFAWSNTATTEDLSGLEAGTYDVTVTDANGCTATESVTIIVADIEAPVVICQDITISLDNTGNASITASDIDNGSTDNCAIDSYEIDVDSFDCTMVGMNMVTLTITDTNGNSSTCTTTVTVEDSESPIAMCQDITVSLDGTGNASITAPDIDNGSTDNCAIDSYEIDVDSFDCTMTGMNMVTLTITDTNGNSSTCTSTVTVEDNELPSISCEAITVSLDETGNISILPEDLLTDTFDNCGIENLSLDIDTFDCEDVGTDVEVTIFAQDASGNMTSCTTTVTVIDDLDPVFTCLADQTVIGNVEESYYIVPDFVANSEVSAVDNCDGEMITISQNPPAGSLLEEGEYDFTFVTTDQNGNTAVCISTITVETGDLSVKTPEVSLKSVDLYPNPAENFIIIDNPQHLKLKEMVIYDLNGRKVLTLDLENYTDNTQLNISKLEAAQYFAMIKSTNNGVVVKRILRK